MMHGSRALQDISGGPGEPKTYRPTPDVLDLLEPFGCTITLRRAHEIYRHGGPTRFCWRIRSGCVRTVSLMGDGRRLIDEFLWPGELLGMDDLGTHYSDAEAVTDVTLSRYPRVIVERQAKTHAALAQRLRTLTLLKLQHAHRQIILLGRKTAMERIASFLLQMNDRSPTPDAALVELPMSRSDIADHLGLSIETVCRYLVNLQCAGTVMILRSGIQLRDRAALLELAS
jgi:CRP/FNR family transcriptional regulator, nitrogen fixation regulation protein